ncbi:hypothetical protein NFHSH190041_18020 [Shewanella sp. NFH-SH190041]|uniref:DUF4156 domain-containing protein n=1 Tax=Shewanella sp. NFH-SH190041 TaxID=2950245 RepID=UPI0021C2DCC2|nr:DUF4156 domain-containing protein [Shewanella sp. NFH-SH190041]BDM64350.1 hypothetical protein NFHSH190041_18020 [Shewanella sp. NFH-SH190041]
MKKMLITALLSTGVLSGCVTFPTHESNQVKVLWDDINALQHCEHKGTVIGSQGHFYDYWLHADRDMVWGTLNEMRIKTADMGADTLYLYQPLGFLGSVTMMGNAYRCNPSNLTMPTTPTTDKPKQ